MSIDCDTMNILVRYIDFFDIPFLWHFFFAIISLYNDSSNIPFAIPGISFCSSSRFQIAPAVGGIVSDLVLNKKTRLPIDPFSFHRFQNHLISKEKSDLTLHG